MKKILIVLALVLAVTSCKNDKESKIDSVATDDKTAKQNDGLILLQGNFIYYADAAVLQTTREMYGVILNDKMHELNNQAKALKNKDTDMVPVAVRVKISKKPEGEEGWDQRVEIIEILKVSPPIPEENEVIKLGTE